MTHRVQLTSGRWLGFAEYGDPLGKPVVYSHGGFSCHLDARPLDAICRKLAIRLLAVDRPGIGLSDPAPESRLLDWPQMIKQLVKQLKIDRFACLGWSAGGPYALACAHQLPHMVTRVALVGGMMPIDEPGKTRELGLLLDRILFPLVRVSRPLAHLVLWVLSRFPLGLTKWSFLQDLTSPADHRLFADADPRQDLDFILEALRGRAGIVHDFVLVGAPWGFDPSELSCPCDIWRGTEDKIVPEVHAHWLAGRISQHRFHLVENCGHFLLRLKGEEVLRELIRG